MSGNERVLLYIFMEDVDDSTFVCVQKGKAIKATGRYRDSIPEGERPLPDGLGRLQAAFQGRAFVSSSESLHRNRLKSSARWLICFGQLRVMQDRGGCLASLSQAE